MKPKAEHLGTLTLRGRTVQFVLMPGAITVAGQTRRVIYEREKGRAFVDRALPPEQLAAVIARVAFELLRPEEGTR